MNTVITFFYDRDQYPRGAGGAGHSFMAPIRGLIGVLLPLLVQGSSSGASMNCGPDVGLCGLLVLESG